MLGRVFGFLALMSAVSVMGQDLFLAKQPETHRQLAGRSCEADCMFVNDLTCEWIDFCRTECWGPTNEEMWRQWCFEVTGSGECTAEATVGYDISNCDTSGGAIREQQCGVTCDNENGYFGESDNVEATCQYTGGFSFTGCQKEQRCTRTATAPPGYSMNCPTSELMYPSQCTVSCSSGYIPEGNGPKAECSAEGGQMTYSGCIENTLCNNECEFFPSMCSRIEYCTSVCGTSNHFEASCNSDDYKDTWSPLTCTCVGGTAAEGSACSANGRGGHICETCDAGHRLANGKCEKHVCTCSGHGIGAEGAACVVDGSDICGACDDGYTLTDGRCVENQCTCSDGTAAEGAACTADGASICIGCNGGFALSDGQCLQTCDAGFTLVDATCVQNQCTCSNGQAVLGSDCTVDGASVCQTCDAGFFLTGGNCVKAEKCACNHGTAAVGLLCNMWQGAELCVKCEAGYTLRSKSRSCHANQCSCKDGLAAWGASCKVDGAEVCAVCKKGYKMTKTSKCAEVLPEKTVITKTGGDM